MPSKRLIPGLHKRAKEPKPVTPLQQQQLMLRKRDEYHAEAAHRNLFGRLKQEENPGDEVPDPAQTDYTNNPIYDADDCAEPNDGGGTNLEFDMNQFMPGNAHHQAEPEEINPLVIDLKRQTHLANRLAHESRWAWQYAIMLPTFLRSRLETCNWGNEASWNQDFRSRCNCVCQTERDVDLVDLLSE